MITKEEYAQLSLYVYSVNIDANQNNKPAIPAGWETLEYNPNAGQGLSYGIFRRIGSTEVIIAYSGTDQKIDWAANILNGVGLSSGQTTAAAIAYFQAKQLYGSNISFTGHSLGGGIASIMAVWFDRPATVFDEAPFEKSARDLILVNYTKAVLALAGYSDPVFTSYTGLFDFGVRESNVTNYYMDGEALVAFRTAFPTIVGSGQDNKILANIAGMTGLAGAEDLHSQALLTSMLLSDDFRSATYASGRVIPLLMDKSFYAYDSKTSDQQNLLINYIRSEQSFGADGKPSHLATDLYKIGANVGGLSLKAQDGVIAQAMEWYYYQSGSQAGKQFFINNATNPSLLQYNSAIGEGLANAQNKAKNYSGEWLFLLGVEHSPANSPGLARVSNSFDQWSVATSSTGVTTTARDATKTQIYIGQGGADNFTGGDKSDTFLAGAGNDTLNGGVGYDLLYGGADTDRYNFTGNFGSDEVIDSDGAGSLWVDGSPLIGGDQLSGTDNIWESGNRLYRYTQVNGDLVISKGSGAGAGAMQGSITVQGWTEGQLGLSLGAGLLAEPTRQTRTGDQRAPIKADGSYDWAATTWTSGGTLTGGVSQIDFADVIYADTLAAAEMNGGGLEGLGNDALSGSSGQDSTEGGMGDDLLAGGAGADRLYGDFDKNGLIIPNLGMDCLNSTKYEENQALGLEFFSCIAILNIASEFSEQCHLPELAGNARAYRQGCARRRRRMSAARAALRAQGPGGTPC